MQQIHTGKCPIVNEECSITVNYIFVPILGTTTRNYKNPFLNVQTRIALILTIALFMRMRLIA